MLQWFACDSDLFSQRCQENPKSGECMYCRQIQLFKVYRTSHLSVFPSYTRLFIRIGCKRNYFKISSQLLRFFTGYHRPYQLQQFLVAERPVY